MSYLLITSRLGCRRFISNRSGYFKRFYAAKKTEERTFPIGCIQHIDQRPYETHDDKNARLKRPLSPHLTIYKAQLQSFYSIMHRITGVVAGVYLMVFAACALFLPYDLDYVCRYIECMRLPNILYSLGKAAFAFPFVYHSVNGIRHLIWDTGKMLNMPAIHTSSYFVTLVVFGTLGFLVFAL